MYSPAEILEAPWIVCNAVLLLCHFKRVFQIGVRPANMVVMFRFAMSYKCFRDTVEAVSSNSSSHSTGGQGQIMKRSKA